MRFIFNKMMAPGSGADYSAAREQDTIDNFPSTTEPVPGKLTLNELNALSDKGRVMTAGGEGSGEIETVDVTISLPGSLSNISLNYITVQNDYIGDVLYLDPLENPSIGDGDIIKVVKNSLLVLDLSGSISGVSDDAAFTDRISNNGFVYGGVVRGPVTLEIMASGGNSPVL